MRQHRVLVALTLVLVACSIAAAPAAAARVAPARVAAAHVAAVQIAAATVAAARSEPDATGPSAAAPAEARAEPRPSSDGGSSVPELLPFLLAGAALVAIAGALWRERGSPRSRARGRVVRRPRREVGTAAYRLARTLGFRYSHSRDALVLRGVGNRVGPVLRLRVHHEALPERTPRIASGRVQRLVDVVSLPLPSSRHGWLWQLTAVDVDAGYTWAELTSPRGATPSSEQALAFVRRIALQLERRGLLLDSVVVQAGSMHRRALATAVELADVQLLRALPRAVQHPIAAERHHAIVAEHWTHVLASPGTPPLDLLERRLQRWVAIENATAGRAPGGELSPTEALGGAEVAPQLGRTRPMTPKLSRELGRTRPMTPKLPREMTQPLGETGQPLGETGQPSGETRESSRETRESSRETRESSRETRESSRETRESSREAGEAPGESGQPSRDGAPPREFSRRLRHVPRRPFIGH